MASTDTKARVAQIATTVQTIGQARAALGVVTQVLQEGYGQLDRLTSVADVRDTARSLLDSNNAYAQKIYATWGTDPSDLLDQDISVTIQLKVATCLEQARSNVKLIEDIASEDIWDLASLLESAIKEATKIAADAGSTLANIAKVPLVFAWSMLQGLWPIVLIAGFGVVVFFWARKRALKALVS